MKTINLLSSALLITICISSTSTLAEFDDMMLDEGDEFILDEIIVTATKRKASLFDVPISLSVVNQEKLENAQSVDILSLSQLDASFSYVQVQSPSIATSFFLRGLGTQGNNSGFEGSVGIFIDGVYRPRAGDALIEFLDIEQIEILRGPQGTLFGRNTSVGALNIKNQAPKLGVEEGFLNLTLGDYDLMSLKGVLNVPLEDSMALRFSGAVRTRDGTIDHAVPNLEESNDVEQYLARLQFLWNSDMYELSSKTIIDAFESDNDCCGSVVVEDYEPFIPGVPSADLTDLAGVLETNPEKRISSEGLNRQQTTEQYGISNELVWTMDSGVELTWLPAYRKSIAKRSGDSDFISRDYVRLHPSTINFDSFTNEFRLQGKIADDRIDWLFGLFYADEQLEDNVTIASNGQDTLDLSTALSNIIFVTAASFPINAFANNKFQQDAKNLAFFTHNIIQLNEAFSLTLGLRYIDESKKGGLASSKGENDACNSAEGEEANFFGPAEAAALLRGIYLTAYCSPAITPAGIATLPEVAYSTFPDERFDDDALTYTVSLSWKISTDWSAYISNSEGFKSGGLNLDVTVGGFNRPIFESEVVNSWEIGTKIKALDGDLLMQMSLYSMDIEDFQVLIIPQEKLSFQTFNLDNVKSEGIEFESSYNFIDNLNLNAKLVYKDTQIGNNCTKIADPKLLALCDSDLSNSPRWTSVTSINWRIPLENHTLTFLPNFRYESRSQPDPSDPDFFQSDNLIIDFGIKLAKLDDKWEATFWGKNITDETKIQFAFPPFGATLTGGEAKSAYLNDPRTFGANFKYNF